MFEGKIEISLYNTDAKQLIKKDLVKKLAELSGFTTAELHSKLRSCTYKTGPIFYSDKLKCNITLRKR